MQDGIPTSAQASQLFHVIFRPTSSFIFAGTSDNTACYLVNLKIFISSEFILVLATQTVLTPISPGGLGDCAHFIVASGSMERCYRINFCRKF